VARGERVLAHEVIRHAGNIMKHVVGVLLLAWRRVLRAFAIAGLGGVVLGEVAGVLLTHHFPPFLLTHVAAVALGAAMGYGAALTVFVDELLKGALDAVKIVEGEVAAGARAAFVLAEREAGEAKGGLLRLLGHRPPAETGAPTAQTRLEEALGAMRRPTRPPARTLGQFPRQGGSLPGMAQAEAQRPASLDETRADVAATDAFNSTAPRPRVNARPVRADQLPRIGWAMEHAAELVGLAGAAEAAMQGIADRRAPAASPEQNQTAEEMPPIPRRPRPPMSAADSLDRAIEDASPPTSEAADTQVAGDAPVQNEDRPPPAPRPQPRPSSPVRTVPVVTSEVRPAAPDTRPLTPELRQPEEPWSPPTTVSVLPATDGKRAAGNDEVADGQPSSGGGRGLWSRIGQALAGNTRPLAEQLDSGDE
jgi:hypothetical protein